MSITLEKITQDLHKFRNNPVAIMRLSRDLLKQQRDTVTMPNAGGPFPYLLENSAFLYSNLLSEIENATRSTYAALAQDRKEFYNHISDRGWDGLFATPSSTTISILFAKDEVIEMAVKAEPYNYSKLVIPKDTQIKANGAVYGLYLPVEIRVLAHGGMEATYDTTVKSPLHSLSDNRLPTRLERLGDKDYLAIDIPLYQYEQIQRVIPIGASAGLKARIPFEDMFYVARAYVKKTNGQGAKYWHEISTTHSEQIHDPTKLTLTLRVLDNELEVELPQIYYNTIFTNEVIRVDVYTTKGEYTVDLKSLDTANYKVIWEDYDNEVDSIFTAPLQSVKEFAVFASTNPSGGRNSITTEEFRKLATRGEDGGTTFTESALEDKLNELGYDMALSVDDVSSRIFIASKILPPPIDVRTSVSIGAMMETVKHGALDNDDGVYTEGALTVLNSRNVYKLNGTSPARLTDSELVTLKSKDIKDLIDELNNNTYLYSPFHYVLDSSKNYFLARPYYLDSPVVTNRTVKEANSEGAITFFIEGYSVSKQEYGYSIVVKTIGGKSVNEASDTEFGLQLSVVPDGDVDPVYMEGDLIGTQNGNRIYEFRLDTEFLIDKDDKIRINNLKGYIGDTLEHDIALNAELEMVLTTTLLPSGSPSNTEIDRRIAKWLMPVGSVGVSLESVSVTLGERLKWLKCDHTAVVSPEEYLTYQVDVPAVYSENVYEMENGKWKIVEDSEGNPKLNRLHAKGDVILNSDDTPKIEHVKGSIKVSNGEKVVTKNRSVSRLVEMFLLDARYLFLTDKVQINYRDSIRTVVSNIVLNDIASIAGPLRFAQTDLYFSPKRTIGTVKISTQENEVRTVSSKQPMAINYTVSKTVHNDLDLRNKISATTISIVNNFLDGRTLSLKNLIDTLDETVGQNVTGIKVEWLGELTNVDTFKIVVGSDNIGLRQKISQDFDDTLFIEDELTIGFSNIG